MPLHRVDDEIHSGGLSEEEGGHEVDFEFDEALQESNIAPSSKPKPLSNKDDNPSKDTWNRGSRSRAPVVIREGRHRDRVESNHYQGNRSPVGRGWNEVPSPPRRLRSRSPDWRDAERGRGTQALKYNDRRERSPEYPRDYNKGSGASRDSSSFSRGQNRPSNYSPPRHIHRSHPNSPPSRGSMNLAPSRSRSPRRRQRDADPDWSSRGNQSPPRRLNNSPPRRNFDRSPPRSHQHNVETAMVMKPQVGNHLRRTTYDTRSEAMERSEDLITTGSKKLDQAVKDSNPDVVLRRNRVEEGEVSSLKMGTIKSFRKDSKPHTAFSIDLNEESGPSRLLEAIGTDKIRAFVARCNYYDILVRSKRTNTWRAPEYVVDRIRKANAFGDHVFLYFSVHLTKYFQGECPLTCFSFSPSRCGFD